MKKSLSIVLLALLVVSISFALTVSVKDKDGFEIDVFNAGETAVITAQAQEQPYITIIGNNATISRQKMKESEQNSGIYIYDFVPKQEGEYAVEIEAGKESEDLTVFAAENLNLDWSEVDAENENQSAAKIVQPNQQQDKPAKVVNGNVLIVSENGTERIIYDNDADAQTGFLDSCLGFLKKLEGILNG